MTLARSSPGTYKIKLFIFYYIKMAINENKSKTIPNENFEIEKYNNSKENSQLSSSDNIFQKTDINNNKSNIVINKIEHNQKEKYIIDKDITKDISIEQFDDSLNIPIKIIYDNHIFILTTNKPKGRKKITFKFILWRRIKDKTSNNFNFCNSTIKCKINIHKEFKYYIGNPHSYDCNKFNNILENNDINISDNNKKDNLKTDLINKIKLYMEDDKNYKKNLYNIKGYVMHLYYKYKYNLYFQINEEWFKSIYYKILNDKYPQDWNIILEKNIINIDKENLIKFIGSNKDEKDTTKINYIIFGYNTVTELV